MRSRLFHRENEDVPGRLMTPPRPSVRKFGTKLSVNSLGTPSSQRSSAKKLVKVRRTPNGLKSTSLATNSPNRSSLDKMIVFSPGPVGLQLEPIKEDPKYGCRVVRFVDGGPMDPGQARKSGKLKPGDLVIQVEASGTVASSYQDIIQILKDTYVTRTLTFRSVWESTFLDSQSKLNHLRIQPMNSASAKNGDRPSTPNANNLTCFKKQTISSTAEPPRLPTMLPPPFPVTGTSILPAPRRARTRHTLMDITLIQSPSQIALLSHVLTQSKKSMPRRRQEKDESDGPMIFHLGNGREAQKKSTTSCPPSPPKTFKIAPLDQDFSSPRTLNYGITADQVDGVHESDPSRSSPSTPTRSNTVSLREANVTDPSYAEEDSSIVSTPAKLSDSFEHSQLFSPSGVKKLSETRPIEETGHHAMLSRVFGAVYNSIAPVVANSSCAVGSVRSAVSNTIAPVASSSYAKIGEVIAGNSASQDFTNTNALKSRVLQELSCAKIAMDVQDITKEEIERSMDELAHEKALLQADFEAKLDAARLQHAEAEKELKELYANTCKQQEIKIQDLEASKARLKGELKESQIFAQERMDGMEMEDVFQLEGVIELTRSELSSKSEELRALQSKEKVLQSDISNLKTENERVKEREKNLRIENERVQEREKNLQIELEMSRTMTREMEQRIVDLESSTANSIQNLTKNMQEKEQELDVRKSLVSNLTTEKGDLFGHIDKLESGIELLQTADGELKSELDKTRKELLESKNEVATMHDTLLNKLEKGETRAQAEVELREKEAEVEEVTKELGSSKEKLNTLESQFRTCRVALFATLLQSKSLERENASATQVAQKLEMDFTELTKMLEEVQDMTIRKDVELGLKNGLVSLLNKEKDDLNALTSKLEEEVEAKHVEMETKSKLLTDSEMQFNTKLATTQGSLANLRMHVELFQRALMKLEGEHVETVSESGTKIDSLHAALEFKAEQQSSLEQSLQEFEEANKKLAEEKYSWQSRFKESEKEVMTTKSAMMSLRNENEEVNAALKSVEEAEAEHAAKLISLETELKGTAEELSHASSKLRRLEQEKKCDAAFLQGSEETLSQAVNVMKGLESDVAAKERDLNSANAQIDELTDNENVLAAESVRLYEKLLELEEKLTSSTEDICSLRRTTSSLQSQKAALEKKLNNAGAASKEKDQKSLDYGIVQQSLIEAENQLRKTQSRAEESEATNMILEADLASLVERVGEELETKDIDLDRERARSLLTAATSQRLASQVSEETRKRNILENKILILKKKLEEAEVKHSLVQTKFQKSAETHDCELRRLESSQHELQTRAEEKELDNEKLRKEVFTAAIEIDSLQTTRAQRESSFFEKQSSFEKEKNMLVGNSLSQERELQSLKEQLSDSQLQLDEIKTAILVVETERDSIHFELAETMDHAEQHRRNARDIGEENATLQVSLRGAKTRHYILEAAKEGLRRRSNQVESQRLELFAELEKRNTEVHSTLNQIKHLESHMNEIVQEHDNKEKDLQCHVFKLQKATLALKAEYIVQHLRCQDLEQLSKAKDSQLVSLRTTLAETQSNISMIEESLHETNAKHKSDIESLESSCVGLKRVANERLEESRKVLEESHSKDADIAALRQTMANLEEALENQHSISIEEKNNLIRLSYELANEMALMKSEMEASTETSLDEIAQLKQSIAAIKFDRNRVHCELAAVQERSEASEQNRRKLTEEKKELGQDLRKFQAKRSFEEAAKEGLRRQSDELSTELEKKRAEACVLNSRVEALQSLLKGMKETCKEQMGHIARVESTSTTLQGLADERQGEIDKLTKENFEAAVEIDALKEDIERFESLLEKKHSRFEEEKNKVVGTSSLLEKNLKSKEKELTAYQDETKELKSKNSDLQTERDSIRGHLTEAHARIEFIDRNAIHLNQEMESLDQANQKQREEKRRVSIEKCIIEAAMKGLRRSSNKLEVASLMMTADLEKKVKENLSLSDDIENLRSQMTMAQEISSKYQRDIQSLKNENTALKGLANQKEQGNGKLVQEVFSAAIEIDLLRTASVQLEDAMTEKQSGFEEEKNRLVGNIDDLEQELTSAQQQLLDTQEETEELKLSIEVIETERNNIRNDLQTVQERAEAFERNARQLTEEKVVLERSNESVQKQMRKAQAQKCFEATAREGLKHSSIKLEGRYLEQIAELEEKNTEISSLNSQTTGLQWHIIAMDEDRESLSREYHCHLLELQKAVSFLRAECVVSHLRSREFEQATTRQLVPEMTDAGAQTENKDQLIKNELSQTSREEISCTNFEGSASSSHLRSFKSAFKSQKQVLANLNASEGLFTDFMREIRILGRGAEGEISELLHILDKCTNSMQPTSDISALDLASAPSAIMCIENVRLRLSRQAALARAAVQELDIRQREFEKWQETRVQPPKTPITPACILNSNAARSPEQNVIVDITKLLNEKIMTPFASKNFILEACSSSRRPLTTTMLQDENSHYLNNARINEFKDDGIARKLDLSMNATIAEERHTRTTADNDDRTKLAGVRLLSSVLERRTRAEKAAAFRKWSCASGAMKATSNQKQASAELSLQLENTMKKLIMLKAHLKKGRRPDLSDKNKKPRLRKLLGVVTEHRRSTFDDEKLEI